ncbi:MAG: N-acetyltransferase [Tepidiformaceae bacterium]
MGYSCVEYVDAGRANGTGFARLPNEILRDPMAFNTDDVRAPEGLRTDEFVLRPILASDAELDYEAVMESKEFLRRWEQSSWPADDFTVDANREDLDKLVRRHADGESFTYTVMNTTETQCLGCVYILPTTACFFSKGQITALDRAKWSAYEVAVYFWIRKARLADELDRRLLDALGTWLGHDWRVENYLIVTNEQFEQQVTLIEGAGLQLKFRFERPNEPGKSLAYANHASGAQQQRPAVE